ncbi:helix-turn-helix domain-containing protein [Saccharopolyspora phatthalungensis]|uniref:Transcriptional regulator with XRE-family HTH domain n=1 Tax=Saccharopolyspora phatthalungensis TaxID=664693 RepID=A0A840Q770_9PSEU|nr:helix-turn-helix transcriptional regulator [Saccharopolyspora phatthalungensis]MBB5155561.1 transcriptional regulator with XRE-family HTH domain [Saccharopolyspora phatthalungensis]
MSSNYRSPGDPRLFASALWEYKNANELTQLELANELGESEGAINAYLHAAYPPSAGRLFAICRKIGVDVRTVLIEEWEPLG